MDIKRTAKFGWIYQESIHFDDKELLEKDKYNRYTLTRIKIWVGKKDERVVIQGIQSFFKDIQTGEEITAGEYRDKQAPFTSVHEFKLEADEYINDLLDQAMKCFDSLQAVRDGYYAHTCSKCAPAFGFFGREAEERSLMQRAEQFYAGA